MAEEGYKTLEVRREGPVGWLIFDRPTAGNALDATMFSELERAWRQLDADPEVAVIVNAANGAAFQTGVDLLAIQRDREAMKRFARQTRDAELAFTAWHLGVRKPVIAAINGVCAGGGLHFVADADIVIASSDATFLDPHVTVGQVTAYEGIALVRQSPMESITRMALVGRHERMTAQRAHELGIVGEVVAPAQLRPAAQELGETIARNSPTAMAVTKQALWRALELGLTDACKAGARDLVSMWGHPDQEEGPLAFAEKRDAAWQPITPAEGHRS